MSGLLTRDEFIAIRDQIALDRMISRGAILWEEAEQALLEARALRVKLKSQYTTKHQRPAIEDEYNRLMLEWASMDAELGDIQRDHRYQWWVAEQKKASGE